MAVKPLLIFAQSARLIAQSATQAGYTVWVADCFLDTDTPAHRKAKLPDLKSTPPSSILNILIKLTRNEPCYLVYGSGIEYCSDLLANLPANISLVGNSFESVQIVNTPRHFFSLLAKLNINHPETQFEPPAVTDKQKWLSKPNISLGGQAIKSFTGEIESSESYFQQYIEGTAGSALFLSAVNEINILSFNKQLNTQQNFLLAGIEAPLTLSENNKCQLKLIIKKICQHIQLRGLNSIDFIIDKSGSLFILELNPRPSASMALIASQDINLVTAHIEACIINSLPNKLPQKATYTGFYYLFSSQKITIAADIQWPQFCSDIPAAGTIIEQNQPICSYSIETNSAQDCQKRRIDYEKQIHTVLNKQT